MNIGVVGGGIFGVASAIELRLRGHRVSLFEQGTIPALNATSNDVSKAIRRTWYGDDDTYVELVERAAAKWCEWDRDFDSPVYHQSGTYLVLSSLETGSPMYESIEVLTGRGAQIEVMSPSEGRARFPQIVVGADETCVYDGWGGYIESGRAVANLGAKARGLGVEVCENTPVSEVEDLGASVQLSVDGQSREFDRLVVAAGAWTSRLLPQMSDGLHITQQEMLLIEVDDKDLFSPGTMPVWSFEPDTDGWYGFPLLREGYTKISKEPLGEAVDPDIDRSGTESFKDQAMAFLGERIPGMASGKIVGGRKCLYTNTPDDHFVIDWAPGSETMLVAGGGSGHGFKFGGSIGEVVADTLEEKEHPSARLFKTGSRFDGNVRRHKHGTRGFAVSRDGNQ